MIHLVTVLELDDGAENGIFGRFLHRMKRHSVHARGVRCPAGNYIVLTAYSGHPDWDKIAAQAGLASHAGPSSRMRRGACTVVLPRELALPEGCPVTRFTPETLALCVLRNTAVQVIRACRIPLYRKSVTLVDPGAHYTDYVRELLCHCITVKVITKEPERYAEISEAMMEELGAGIVYADSPGLCEDSMLVVSPRPQDAAMLCTKAPVLTAGEPEPYSGCRLVGAPEVRAGPEWAIPRGIAPLDLLGAFYELGGWPKGDAPTAASMRCGSRTLTVPDIAGYIEQNYR